MVDIHTHILPLLDDGSDSLEMSLQMARQALECGTKHIVASSHYNLYPYSLREYKEALDTLRRALQEENLPLKLYTGQELMLNQRGIELLKKGQVLTINDSSYVLLEFDFEENPDRMLYLLDQVRRLHYIPIIAHPERYYALQDDILLAEEFRHMGCVLQCNGGSLLGGFGKSVKRTADDLLNAGMIQILATDAHDDRYRTTDTTDLNQWLQAHYSPSQIKLWTSENPSRVIKNTAVLIEKRDKKVVQE